jgi:hypothetical protein
MNRAEAPRRTGAVSSFGFNIGGLHYAVDVARDFHRGGYSARLRGEEVGTLMEPNGTSPSDALTRLARELWAGDAVDKKIAKEITRYAWFPLELR